MAEEGAAASDRSGAHAPRQHSFSQEQLESMLKNYRLRRKLGALDARPADEEAHALRWCRQAWRPHCILPVSEGTAAGGHSSAAEAVDAQRRAAAASAAALVAEMQRKAETGYRELNAERRSAGALEQGLQRQGDSLRAIQEESGRVKKDLEALKREAQERVAENGRLSAELARRRTDRAQGLTQAALLASAVGRLSEGNRPEEELKAMRLQIAALVEENETLEQQLKH
ncbi:unnamed protein product [Polarella glacialis]|uniref:Uncharacterized protein n=1 Tax=Polarella glacialis TaxID=89957 RepID=A0A813IG77_POLGL|nr:unnamed protein product [Polarella glacialis]